MAFEELESFIAVMYEQKFEDDLWEQFLSNPFSEGSFEEFKQEALRKAEENSRKKDTRAKKVIEIEAAQAEKNALDILDQFGGDALGG